MKTYKNNINIEKVNIMLLKVLSKSEEIEAYWRYNEWQDVLDLIVLCKACSVLLCVLEQPRVDNSSVCEQFGPIGLRPALMNDITNVL